MRRACLMLLFLCIFSSPRRPLPKPVFPPSRSTSLHHAAANLPEQHQPFPPPEPSPSTPRSLERGFPGADATAGTHSIFDREQRALSDAHFDSTPPPRTQQRVGKPHTSESHFLNSRTQQPGSLLTPRPISEAPFVFAPLPLDPPGSHPPISAANLVGDPPPSPAQHSDNFSAHRRSPHTAVPQGSSPLSPHLKEAARVSHLPTPSGTVDVTGASLFSGDRRAEGRAPEAWKLVVVTAANDAYFREVSNLVGSLHENNPGLLLAIYDLGLSAGQRAQMASWKHSLVVDLWFDELPSHVRELSLFAWKAVVIDDALRRYHCVLYLDAGVEVRGSLRDLECSLLEHGHWFTLAMRHSLRGFVHAGMHSFLNAPSSQFEHLLQLAGGMQGYVQGSVAAKNILQPLLECSLLRLCIAPHGSTLENHRFDQAALSIFFHSASFFSVERTQRPLSLELRCSYYSSRSVKCSEEAIIYTRRRQPLKPYSASISLLVMDSLSSFMWALRYIPTSLRFALELGGYCNANSLIESVSSSLLSAFPVVDVVVLEQSPKCVFERQAELSRFLDRAHVFQDITFVDTRVLHDALFIRHPISLSPDNADDLAFLLSALPRGVVTYFIVPAADTSYLFSLAAVFSRGEAVQPGLPRLKGVLTVLVEDRARKWFGVQFRLIG